MLSYSSDDFEENLPTINEKITFNEDLKNKTVSVYCIDKNTTNPYRMWEKMGCPEIGEDVLKILRKEAKLKPVVVDNVSKELEIELSPNAMYLITVEV
jgi:beta-xylosidase